MLTNVIIWKSCFILKLWLLRVSYAAFVMHHIKHCHGQNCPWWILKFLKGNFLKFTRRSENDICCFHIEFTLIQIEASFAHWIKVLEVYCQTNIEFAFLYNIRNSHILFSMIDSYFSNLLCSIPLTVRIGLSQERMLNWASNNLFIKIILRRSVEINLYSRIMWHGLCDIVYVTHFSRRIKHN